MNKLAYQEWEAWKGLLRLLDEKRWAKANFDWAVARI